MVVLANCVTANWGLLRVKRGWLVLALISVAFVFQCVAAPLSGSFDTSISIVPSGTVFSDSSVVLSANCTVAYSLNGWTVESETTYDDDGLAGQEFTAVGWLGAFTIDSTVRFNPRVETSATYVFPSSACLQTQSVTGVTDTGLSSHWGNPIWNCLVLTKTSEYRPAFSSLELSAQTSLYGTNLEGLFYLKGNDVGETTVSGKWIYGNPYGFCAPGTYVTQTGSHTISSCLPRCGSGWKFTISGMLGDILLTSRAYFNLEEYSYNELMTLAKVKTHTADELALGGVYYLPKVGGETCNVTFTRQYITLEGITFGCAQVDVGVNFSCSGFDWFKVLVTDIDVLPILSLDALIKFSTAEKTFSLDPNLTIAGNSCISFKLAWDWDAAGSMLAGLKINGVSLSYAWGNVTFATMTSFNPVYDSLGGYYLAAPVVSPTKYGFFVPDTSFGKDTFDTDTAVGYYTQVCYPDEYYDIWEAAIISTQGDGCCGGSYSFRITTYFGDRKLLEVNSFGFLYADEDGDSYGYNPVDITTPAVLGSAVPYCEDDAVNYGVGYYDAPANTLFGWVKTDAAIVIPISASFDLTFSSAINIYGWEKLELGFSVSW